MKHEELVRFAFSLSLSLSLSLSSLSLSPNCVALEVRVLAYSLRDGLKITRPTLPENCDMIVVLL